MNELVVIRLRGDRVVSVSHECESRSRSVSSVHREAQWEFARLLAAYPSAYVAWYDERLKPYLTDPASWVDLIHHPLEVLHLSAFQRCDEQVRSLGLVEFESPFLLPGTTEDRFGTWLISSMAGIGRSSLFRAAGFDASLDSFALALFDAGFRGSQHGMCAYSEPRMLDSPPPDSVLEPLRQPLPASDVAVLVARIQSRRWVLFWLAANVAFRGRLPLRAALRGLREKVLAAAVDVEALRHLHPQLATQLPARPSVEVIIPTLGRRALVKDVLEDLARQTVTPELVTVVEQQPEGTDSEGELLSASSDWPFRVRHEVVRWTGACRARNLALRAAEAEWILILDDDIRFSKGLLAYLLRTADAYHVDVVNAAVYVRGQTPPDPSTLPRVWATFGSGICMMTRESVLRAGLFDERLEGGYGEDYEYGLRLRLTGSSILYAPGEPILHLKAPVGGFRRLHAHPWHGNGVQPRPSPTVLYSRRKFATPEMAKGYALYVLLNSVCNVSFHQWPLVVPRVTREWKSSVRWATHLSEKIEAE